MAIEAALVTAKPKKHWGQVGIFSICALLFWVAEFAWQYYRLLPGILDNSLINSFGITGATLIGLALLLSAIFKWFPRTAQYWRWRRYLGVSGVVFITFHVSTVMRFIFHYDLVWAYFSLNPLKNPIVFGSIAYFILFVMALTSTDWMVEKIGSKRWKFIHRFVYFAYISAILHFISMKPRLYREFPGMLLVIVTGAALFGQLFWFIKTVSRRGLWNWGFLVGLTIIVTALVFGYLVWQRTYGYM